MKAPRSEIGTSDPISYSCSCSAKNIGGKVLLFYRYWTNTPQLPLEFQEKTAHPEELAQWHRDLTEKFHLNGKIRIAKEGFNITVGGITSEIEQYITQCCNHWSFQGIPLVKEEQRNDFFKPTPGCACVFGPAENASVRVTSEITPMGVEGYIPSQWDKVESLSPEAFHRKCYEDGTFLIDVRNSYESKIGYFINPRTSEPALRPPIRRFSQWPQYVRHRLRDVVLSKSETTEEPRQILTYCTGGIRCEKGVRWMQESGKLPSNEKVYTLHGGIAAYLTWMDEEIKQGRKQPSESLFRGRNYVFDARGSTGLTVDTDPVSNCHICGVLSDNLSKCWSKGCHLILVVCHNCASQDVRCCESCRELDLKAVTDSERPGPRPMCECEQTRENELWGGERPAALGHRKKGKTRVYKAAGSRQNIELQINTID